MVAAEGDAALVDDRRLQRGEDCSPPAGLRLLVGSGVTPNMYFAIGDILVMGSWLPM
jgi:hypothetical protein